MWKDSYKTGISKIDDQHRELFRVTGGLLTALNEKEYDEIRDDCIDTVTFLKNYAVEHFADEEKYQAETNYSGIEAHKKLHVKFIQTVLSHERKMINTNFSSSTVRDFTGMLVAWLTYHVVEEDQRYANNKVIISTEPENETILAILQACTCDVLNSTAGLRDNEIKKILSPEKGIKGDISFIQSFAGDIMGDITYVVTKPLALQLFEIMTSLKLKAIDDIVVASLTEIFDIIGEKSLALLTKNGYNCSIVATDLKNQAVCLSGEQCLGLYSLVGNMGIYDDSIHN